MKVSLIAKGGSGGWHAEGLRQQAQTHGFKFEVTDIRDLNTIKEDVKRLGEVVIWRAASIDINAGRTVFINSLKDKVVINSAIAKYPYLPNKLFQQKTAEKYPGINTIPTFSFKTKKELISSIRTGTLKFPLIQKPELGSKGNGVTLLKSIDEIENQEAKISQFVYQNYIENNGDFRVLILGGRALGAIKRTAQEGSYLNNVSKGGKAEVVTDPEVLTMITDIALTIASLFELTMCGVDVMYDVNEDKYYFLEVNTAPQWEGFQNATGINVAEEIIKYAQAMTAREKKTTVALVKDYYDNSFPYLLNKQNHYAQRMYLWTKEEKYKNWLEGFKKEYIGETEEETKNLLQNRILKEIIPGEKTISQNLRKKHFEKYPRLRNFNSALFLNLFAKTIYQKNVSGPISEIIPDNEFLAFAHALSNDREALLTLSTHAINYFYLLENYFDDKGESRKIVQPEYYLQLSKEIDLTEENLRFKIYLLTHCIIGASKFYYQKIEKDIEVYKEMLKLLENMIYQNYFQTSLDNKFEYLVCCKLLGIASPLETLILQEADRSLSDSGNYLVDRLNFKAKNRLEDKITITEHKNVLYLMANLEKS